jgi:hypothetical protein
MAAAKLNESLEHQPYYRMMTAEQAVKILDRIFADDSVGMIEVRERERERERERKRELNLRSW